MDDGFLVAALAALNEARELDQRTWSGVDETAAPDETDINCLDQSGAPVPTAERFAINVVSAMTKLRATV
jgi:hypothetical protein